MRRSGLAALALLAIGCGPESAEPTGEVAQRLGGGERVASYVVLERPPAVAVLHRGMPSSRPEAVARVRKHLSLLEQDRDALRPHLEAEGAVVMGELARLANAFVVLAPRHRLPVLEKLPGVRRVEIVPLVERSLATALPVVGAPQAWSGVPGLQGDGVRIGIVDSGIDYLHADFGGSGDPQDYLDNDRTIIEPNSFPTARVVGGFDFAGDDYDASDPFSDQPAPDPDPLDCGIFFNSGAIGGGHGSHVAGIAAGNGVLQNGAPFTGPYDQSFDASLFRVAPGVAPRAELYALKVFGCSGSTALLSLALERAADPDEDGDFGDRLDVVNASLGSPYALGSSVQAELLENLTAVGSLFVAASGNEDHVFFVTGSPGSHSHALSVAASSDSGLIDLQVTAPASIAGGYPAAEGSFTTPLVQSGPVSGALVAAVPAEACAGLTNGAEVAGNIALIDRGSCPFVDKLAAAAAAGARAAVVIDNELAPAPFAMAGGPPGTSPIPGVMIRRVDGEQIRTELAQGVAVTLDASRLYQGPDAELMTGFSSRGPSSVDGSLKPEITAPGAAMDSAAVATGIDARRTQGTSMATPMVAGAAALVRQARPELGPIEVKAVLMNSAAPLTTAGGVVYPPSLQGAGRLDAAAAVERRAFAAAEASDGSVAVSFGALVASEPVALTREVRVTNRGSEPLDYAVGVEPWHALAGVEASVSPPAITVAAGGSELVTLTLSLDPAVLGAPGPDAATEASQLDLPRHHLVEAGGRVVFTGDEPLAVPFHATVRAASQRAAGEPLACEAGAQGLFIPIEGASAHPTPWVSAYQLGALDEPAPSSAAPMLDILAIGSASDAAVQSSFDQVSLHFTVAVAGSWTTPARGSYSLVSIHIDTNLDGIPDYVIRAEPYQDEDPFADVLTATTYDVATGAPLPTRRFLNLVPADVATTEPFFNSVLAFSVFAADLGLTEEASTLRYRAVSISLATESIFDDTDWVTIDAKLPALDTVSGSALFGKPLYRGDQAVAVRVADGLAETPQLLLLHHTNELPEHRFEVLDPIATGRESLAVSHAFPEAVREGERLASYVEIANEGSRAVHGVRLRGTISGGALDLAAPARGTCADPPALDCQLGTLEPGESVRVSVQLDALGAGALDLDLEVTSGSGCLIASGVDTAVTAEPAPPPLVSSGGCGCRATPREQGRAWLPLLLLGLVALRNRRRVG